MQVETSVVLQRDRVGSDIHLRLVFGDLDDPALTDELGAELAATRFAGTVETFVHRRRAARADERLDVGHAAAEFMSIEPGKAPVCSPWSMKTCPLINV